MLSIGSYNSSSNLGNFESKRDIINSFPGTADRSDIHQPAHCTTCCHLPPAEESGDLRFRRKGQALNISKGTWSIWVLCEQNQGGSCGALGQRSTFYPPFLTARLQPPRPSLSCKGPIGTVANQGRSRQEATWGKTEGAREAHQGYETNHLRPRTHPNTVSNPSLESERVSGSVVSNSLQSPGLVAYQALLSWDSLGKNTRAGCHFLLQGIFPTQGSNPGLLHFRQILYHLSCQESPPNLEPLL